MVVHLFHIVVEEETDDATGLPAEELQKERDEAIWFVNDLTVHYTHIVPLTNTVHLTVHHCASLQHTLLI